MTNNFDADKYMYSDYGVGFDALGSYSSSDGSGFGKNLIIFGVDMSSTLRVDNKES